jgi:hypothetical protein
MNSEQSPGAVYEVTTGADGSFAFTGLPGGWYQISFLDPDGWLVKRSWMDTAHIAGSTNDFSPDYLATRPLSESLQASISFDQPTYHAGDTATVTITLTNLTTTTLTGIGAKCNPAGDPDHLTCQNPGWAPFNTDAGATAPPGTSTFHVSETIRNTPSGVVTADAYFGDTDPFDGDPYAIATASVTRP